MMPSFTVRIAANDDASHIAFLLTALGHVTPIEQVVSMWHSWTIDGNRAYVAASPSGKLAGIVTIHLMRVLHRPMPVGRITALYVVEAYRKLGIGKALVETAEIDLADQGCGLIEVTSNDRLVAAHAFYEHLGYTRTSVRLAKALLNTHAAMSHDVTNKAVHPSGGSGEI
jgi:GNAT superfamily N-acetyltransferase